MCNMWWNGKYTWGTSVPYLSPMVVMKKSTCVKIWVVNWYSHSFDRMSFLLKRMIDKLRLFSLEYLAHISSKMNYCNWAYYFKENNLVFVGNKKNSSFQQKLFWKTYTWHKELDNFTLFKTLLGGFPDGPVVKNPPSNPGDTGSISGRGTKIPHAMGQTSWRKQLLSPHAATKTRHSQTNIFLKERLFTDRLAVEVITMRLFCFVFV